jgi:hypothetical protein
LTQIKVFLNKAILLVVLPRSRDLAPGVVKTHGRQGYIRKRSTEHANMEVEAADPELLWCEGCNKRLQNPSNGNSKEEIMHVHILFDHKNHLYVNKEEAAATLLKNCQHYTEEGWLIDIHQALFGTDGDRKDILKKWQLSTVKTYVNCFRSTVSEKRSEQKKDVIVPLLAHEMGLGKTLTAIASVLMVHRSLGMRDRPLAAAFPLRVEVDLTNTALMSKNLKGPMTSGIIIIVAPKATQKQAWGNDVGSFTKFAALIYSGSNRKHDLNNYMKRMGYAGKEMRSKQYEHHRDRVAIIIVSWETMITDCGIKVEQKNKENNKQKQKVAPKAMKRKAAAAAEDIDMKEMVRIATAVIFDEIHRAKRGPAEAAPSEDYEKKRPASKKFHGQKPSQAWHLVKYVSEANPRVLGLTGTPVANRVHDMPNLANALSWQKKYHRSEWFRDSSEADVEKFRKERLIRLLLKDAGIDLPEKYEKYDLVPFTSDVEIVKHYASASHDLIKINQVLPRLMGAAQAGNPRARAQVNYLKGQLCACITTTQMISAAPLSWSYSKLLADIKFLINCLKYCLRVSQLGDRNDIETAQKKKSENGDLDDFIVEDSEEDEDDDDDSSDAGRDSDAEEDEDEGFADDDDVVADSKAELGNGLKRTLLMKKVERDKRNGVIKDGNEKEVDKEITLLDCAETVEEIQITRNILINDLQVSCGIIYRYSFS